MKESGIKIFERLSLICRYFDKGKFLTSYELSVKCNVSEKTIYRDIRLLRENYDAPLEYDFKRRGFHFTRPFKLNRFDFSASELFNLAVIYELINSHKSNPYKEGQKTLYNKLRQSYGDEINRQIEIVKDKISFSLNPAKKYNSEVFKKIEEALLSERTVNIKYFKTEIARRDERTIDPYHLRNFSGDWYLIGYDHNRKKIRILSVNRILSVKLTNRYFDVPDEFNVKKYFHDSFGKKRTSKLIRVNLEIKKPFASKILERNIHHSQKIKNLNNGNVLVTLYLNELSEIKDWLMTKGSEITVISPERLIEEIKKEAKEILQTYK